MNSDEILRLDNQLCFLVYACSRAMTNAYRPMLADLGLTYPQYLVMLVLWEEGEISVKQLGEKLYLDSGTLTPLLKRMEAAGLITRNRAKSDERSVVVHITPEGEKLKQKAISVPEKLFCRAGLTPEEYYLLRRQLSEMFHHLQDETNCQLLD